MPLKKPLGRVHNTGKKWDQLPDGEKAGKVLQLWGWEFLPCECGYSRCDKALRWKSPLGYFQDDPPDVLSDLNVAAQMEKEFGLRLSKLYIEYLSATCSTYSIAFASPYDRCRAFVLTEEHYKK